MTSDDIKQLAEDVARWREAKGFVTSWENATQKLFLTICELAEAGECVRKGQWETYQDNGKPEGFPAEIADAAIRLLDLIGSLDLDPPEFLPVAFEQPCRTDTMLDVLLELTGDLHQVACQLRSIGRAAVFPMTAILGKLYTISQVVGFDLLGEIESKHRYNHTRPYRHGTVNEGAA